MWSRKSKDALLVDEMYSTAIQSAIQASNRVLEYWPNPLNRNFSKDYIIKVFNKPKGVGNYSTIPDQEAESIILKNIKDNLFLKDHRILSEETDEKKSNSEYQWIIDPIDGTQNFRNGLPDFGVSIGILKNDEPFIGVIAMPVFGQVVAAIKGEGAKLFSFDGRELLDLTTTNYTIPFENAMIAYDTGYENKVGQMRTVYKKIGDKVGYVASYCSSSVSNYRVAMGQVGGFFHEVPTKYDIAAAAVLISEVGGVVTDIKGKPIDWTADKVSFLGARTPEIHRQLLDLLQNKSADKSKKRK